MRIDKPGIYDISFDEYLADPCVEPSLSSGIAHRLCTSTPAHARQAHPRLSDRVEDDGDEEKFDIGTLAHAIVLQGVNNVEILQWDNFRTKAAREERDVCRANGRIPLLAKVWADVEAMVNAFRDQLDAKRDGRAMFRDGKPEQTLIWQEGGIWCRARADWLRPGAIDDYKTSRRTANPESLSRSLFGAGWDIQSAFYRRGLQILTGERAEFRFAVQECYRPYATSVIALGPQADVLAEKKVIHAIETWATCLKTDRWPSYPDRTAYVSLPPWVEAEWVEKEERELEGAL
jgi:hypothetical protein